MLSFTEFFTKKKIDIKALQQAKPDLYHEFDRDYALMGEKSFDHSKKFWFNRLRKEYLLQEIEISEPKKVEDKVAATSTGSVIEESTAKKPMGFRPKFKSATVKPAEEKPVEEAKEQTEKTESKPATGFKPRFKASTPPVSKDATNTTEESTKAVEVKGEAREGKEAPAKPKGFTPRFKAANLPKKVEPEKKEEDIKDSNTEAKTEEVKSEETASKPKGFTPRFKATNLPKKVEAESSREEDASKANQELAGESKVPESNEEPKSKPTGFKPRFKAGVTKTNTNQEEKEPENPKVRSEEAEPQQTSKPIGFKPRFAAKKSTDQKNKED